MSIPENKMHLAFLGTRNLYEAFFCQKLWKISAEWGPKVNLPHHSVQFRQDHIIIGAIHKDEDKMQTIVTKMNLPQIKEESVLRSGLRQGNLEPGKSL